MKPLTCPSRSIKFLLLIIFVFYSISIQARSFYFSSLSGDDNRTETQAQNPSTPWKTLNKFNSYTGFLPGDAILFKRGEMFYGSMIVSSAGTSAQPITIGAYGSGARPIITGLQTISAWTSTGRGIFENTCTSCQANLNMITFQDALQPMGRWPKLTASNGGYLSIDSHSGDIYLTSSGLSGVLNYVGGEVVSRKLQWVMSRERITAQTNNSLSCVSFESASGDDDDFYNNHGFFIQNHVNACTTLGEWAYDPNTKKIKMYFGAANPSAYTIQVTTLDYLVTVRDTKNYIVFDNITFKGSNSGTFVIGTCKYIQINNCDIKFSGIDAISITHSSSTSNITVSNCNISYSNNNAITAKATPNWMITKNTILNTGMVRGAGSQSDCEYEALSLIGSNSLVQNNIIKNTGYIGVNFRGDFVTIRNNYIDSFCIIKTDGAGVYTIGNTGTSRKVIGNIITNGIGDNYGRGADLSEPDEKNNFGIQMDDETKNVQIDSNTVANCDFDGIQLRNIQNIQIRGNTFFNNGVSQMALYSDNGRQSVSSLTMKNNIFFAKDSAQLAVIMNFRSNYISSMGIIDSNYYCRPLWEPSNIDAVGYSKCCAPGWYSTYTDGGVLQAVVGSTRFKSLDKWQSYSNQDAHSHKTFATLTGSANIRFEYNPTSSPILIFIGRNQYTDIKGNPYPRRLTLAPYSSAILLKNTAINRSARFTNTVVFSNTVNITGSPTDIQKLSVYPNPFKTLAKIQIYAIEPGPIRLDLFDLEGRRVRQLFAGSVKQGEMKNFEFKAGSLSDGTYIIRFTSKIKVFSKKITLLK